MVYKWCTMKNYVYGYEADIDEQCGRCQSLEHIALDCTNSSRHGCNICGNTLHCADACKLQSKCGTCSKRGHHANSCPEAHFLNCGEYGHLSGSDHCPNKGIPRCDTYPHFHAHSDKCQVAKKFLKFSNIGGLNKSDLATDSDVVENVEESTDPANVVPDTWGTDPPPAPAASNGDEFAGDAVPTSPTGDVVPSGGDEFVENAADAGPEPAQSGWDSYSGRLRLGAL
ncbi:hypothetical protein DL95DRAFT_470343 [Leptodontidium sp. 2 PMI_412]|nr:hypothetical protein DL95DRAFT_470343 [Leptodontidium sp. 2 PMI_412]